MQGNPRGGAGQGARGGTVIFASPPPLALPQAAILQQTAEYIFSLEQEKTRLLQQNTQLKRFIQVLPRALRGHGPGGWGRFLLLGVRPRTWRGGERMEAPTLQCFPCPQSPFLCWGALGCAGDGHRGGTAQPWSGWRAGRGGQRQG